MTARVRASSQLAEETGLADSRLSHELERCREPLIELIEELVERADFLSAADKVLGKCDLPP